MKKIILLISILSTTAFASSLNCKDYVFDYLGKVDGPINKKILQLNASAEKHESLGEKNEELKNREQNMKIQDLMHTLTNEVCK